MTNPLSYLHDQLDAWRTEGSYQRLREIVTARAGDHCQALHDAIQAAVTEFTEGAPQSDDITLVVLEKGSDAFS